MAIAKLTDLQRLALDTYKGIPTGYSSQDEAENRIREAVVEVCGGEWNFYNFQENKWKVYKIMAEVLTIAVGETLEDKFSDFVEVRDTELGDKPTFEVENNDLFRISTIASGTNDLRRQKLYNGSLDISTEEIGCKIYEDWTRFIAGRVNFQKLIDKVMKSFAHEIGVRIYNAIYGSYAKLSATYAKTGTFSADVLAEMVGHVEATTGIEAKIYGTKKALGKITSAQVSEKMKDELNTLGHYGVFQGTELVELPQAHKAGTDEFAVADDFLLVVPNGERIVKMVLEGDAFVVDSQDGGARNDRQIEYLFTRRAGVGVLIADVFGIYKLS